MSGMSTWGRWFLGLGIAMGGAIVSAVSVTLAFSESAQAQELKPIADNTLGAESSVVTPINPQVDQINGGAIRGANLFHSFSRFDIGEGREAYFTNPSGIENILSWVTGIDPSRIFGKLGVLGEANLFLINPNGIIFGKNASLDIRGSFVASTASSLKFPNGNEFSATSPQTAPLLTISVPLGLQLGTNNSGTIANAGNLTVGQNLTLEAGNLDLQGQLQAGGNLTLQAFGNITTGTLYSYSSGSGNGGNITLNSSQGAINTSAGLLFAGVIDETNQGNGNGGAIALTAAGDIITGTLSTDSDNYGNGGEITLNSSQGSINTLQGFLNSESVYGNGGAITLNADGGDITTGELNSRSQISGNGGNITLDALGGITTGYVNSHGGTSGGNITLISKEGAINTTTGTLNSSSNSNGGAIALNAKGDITTGSLLSYGGTSGGDITLKSTAGAINTTTGTLNSSSANGNGGDITLSANGKITTASILSNNASIRGSGNGGNISLSSTTGAIDTRAGTLRATTGDFSSGNGGTVTLKAENNITTFDILSNVGYGSSGNAGNISLTSEVGGIKTSTGRLDAGTTFGNSGTITLQARNDITTADLSSSVVNNGRGNAGNILLTSKAEAIDTSAGTLYSISENGNGGAIALTAAGNITTGTLYSYSIGSGNGGNITLNSRQGKINTLAGEGLFTGIIDPTNQSNGDGGAITLTAVGDIITGTLSTDSDNYGNGGDITLYSRQGKINTLRGVLDSESVYGNGGAITLNADGGDITTGKVISISQISGNGGNITFTSTAGVIDTSAGTLSSISKNGNSGAVTLTAQKDITAGNIRTFIVSEGSGKAGDISLTSKEGSIRFVNSRVESFVDSKAEGNSGDINIRARSLSLTGLTDQRTFLITDILGKGNAGNISVNVTGDMSLVSSTIRSGVREGAEGTGGKIDIQAGSLSMTDISELIADTNGKGDAGGVFIEVDNSVSLTKSTIFSTAYSSSALGNAGDINIKAGSLSLTDGAQLQTLTRGRGNAGDVSINVRDQVRLEGNGTGIFSLVDLTGEGDGGDLSITAGSLSLTNSSTMQTRTQGQGNAGNVFIQAQGAVSLTNSTILGDVVFGATGKGGDVSIKAESLFLTNGAQLLASTSGQGKAGNIQINTSDSVNISGVNLDRYASGLFTTSEEGASAEGGEIRITTGAFNISNGAVLNARTRSAFSGGNIIVDAKTVTVTGGGQILTNAYSTGKAGNITLDATDNVTISGSEPTSANRFIRIISQDQVINDGAASGLFARTTDTGSAGDLTINTGQLLVQDGAQVSASTSGLGAGGTLKVIAQPGSVKVIGSGSRLTTETTNTGTGGTLQISTRQLQVKDGAQVSASTVGLGKGGTLQVNAPAGSVEVIGSGSRLSAESSATGSAGSLTITTRELQVKDGAAVTVSAPKGQAGNLTLTADSILLNQGQITAVTGAGEESGNITLQDLDLLRMRRNSLISATALNDANGGNITINAKNGFIVAVPAENSDILAQAIRGNGGRIEINATGIYGLKNRTQQPEDSNISEINASSDFGNNGTVELNTPEIDPNSGLINSPTVPVDTELAQGCYSPGYAQSSFTITGRGGLPPNPKDVLTPDIVQVDWVTLDPNTDDRKSASVATTPTSPTPEPIVEATGWVFNAKGEVVFTADAPTITSRSSWQTAASCRTSFNDNNF